MTEDDLETHRSALRWVALNLARNGQDADDLVQETMLRAWKQRGQYQPNTNLRAWLIRILNNAWIDVCRRRARKPEVPFDLEAHDRGSPRHALENAVLDRLDLADNERLIAKLTPAVREVARLEIVEGLKPAEIAERLAIKRGTASVYLLRAAEQLRKELAKAA